MGKVYAGVMQQDLQQRMTTIALIDALNKPARTSYGVMDRYPVID